MKSSKKGCYYFVLLLGFVVFSSCYETKEKQLEKEKQELLNLVETYDAIPFVNEWNGKKIPGELEVKKYPQPIDISILCNVDLPLNTEKSPLYNTLALLSHNDKTATSLLCKYPKQQRMQSLQRLKEKGININETESNLFEALKTSKYLLGELKYKEQSTIVFQLNESFGNCLFPGIYFFYDNGHYYIPSITEIEAEFEKYQSTHPQMHENYNMIYDKSSERSDYRVFQISTTYCLGAEHTEIYKIFSNNDSCKSSF